MGLRWSLTPVGLETGGEVLLPAVLHHQFGLKKLLSVDPKQVHITEALHVNRWFVAF